MWSWLGVIIAVVLIGRAFNGAARRRNRTAEAWSQIEVELERRHDLVANLVETARGYAQHVGECYTLATGGQIIFT